MTRRIERGITWTVTSVMITSQANLFPLLFVLLGLLGAPEAKAARLGTSTLSAGSAPLPAATAVESFQPDLFTGRAGTSHSILVPPGRRGLQPTLTLTYSSSSRNGWVGVGWNCDPGFIERSSRMGVPRYNSDDTFTLVFQNINSDLVKRADGTYRAKDEGGFARVADLGGAGWEVRDRSGTRYRFGQTYASRVSRGTNVFRWALDQVIDANGNSMRITYAKFGELTYPSTIDYTAHEATGLPPANQIRFVLEDRPDVESSLRAGFKISVSKRLAAIEARVAVNGSMAFVRRYELSYRQSLRTRRSLLIGVRQIGTDGTTALPPVSYSWQDAVAPVYSRQASRRATGTVGWNIRYASYDCGHDNYGCVHPYGGGPCGPPNYIPSTGVTVPGGMSRTVGPALVSVATNGSIQATGNFHDWQVHAWTAVYLRQPKVVALPLVGGWDVCCLWIEDLSGVHGPFTPGNLAFAGGWSLIHLVAYNQNDDRADGFGLGGNLVSQVDVMNPSVLTEPQLAGDVDGNGVADVIDFNSSTGDWGVSCAQLCNLPPGAQWLSGFGNASTLPIVGEFNGDGRIDVALFNNGRWQFATSSGSNFVAGALPDQDLSPGQPFTGDFDGDGIMDLGSYNVGLWTVALGTGSNFVSHESFTISDIVTTPAQPLQHLTGDFNGDGLTDIGVLEGGRLTVAASDGTGWQVSPPWPVAGLPTDGIQSADLNGDGLSDLSYLDRATGQIKVAWNTNNGLASPISLSTSLTFTQVSDLDQVQVADFNGDSHPDLAVFNSTTGNSEIGFSEGGPVDLLNGIQNSLGGTTTIMYSPPSAVGNHFLPFLVPLVTQTVVNDGLGNSLTNIYRYSQGLYDGPSREFRGFGRVEVQDGEGNLMTTMFHQDAALKGRPRLAELRDGAGSIYTRTTNLWEAVQPYPDSTAIFVRLAESDAFTFDGGTAFRQVRSRFSYDAYGNVTTNFNDGDVADVTDNRSAVTTFVINETAWMLDRPSLIQSRNASGAILAQRRCFYDGAVTPGIAPVRGNLTREEEWLDRDRAGMVNRWIGSTLVYDQYGNVVVLTDALGNSVSNSFDAFTKTFLVQTVNALGHVQATAYDPRFGCVTSSIDANGARTTTEYDALGRISRVIGPLDSPTWPTLRYDYDLSRVPGRASQFVRVRSGEAQELVTHSFSDGLGRTIQVRCPAQQSSRQLVTKTVAFNATGRVSRQWLPYLDATSTSYRPPSLPEVAAVLGPPAHYSYDPLGRLQLSTDPDGSKAVRAYDRWRVTTTDANQHVRRRTSDAFGRLQRVEELRGVGTNATVYATTLYQYDARDNITRITDTLGNVTSLQYDSLGRKIKMTDPDMGAWTYAYDDRDKLTTQTDARGVSVRFAYDALCRLIRKDYLIPPTAAGVPTNQQPAQYFYDKATTPYAAGRLTGISDASGTLDLGYDPRGRVVTETKVVDGVSYKTERAYDLLNRLISVTYPNKNVTSYSYNPQGGIDGIAIQSPGQPIQPIVTAVSYNAGGQILHLTYGNGVSTDYSYNPQTLRLARLTTAGPAGVLQDFTYQFDPVGNVRAITDAVHTATQAFTYDSLNRLVSANGARYGSRTFAYNSIGNLTTKEGVTQTYDAINHRPHAVTNTSSGVALSYDANGNMVFKTAPGRLPQILTFDAENRLVEVASPNPARKLDPGWSAISFPQLASDTPIAAVLTNFTRDYAQLSRFNATSNLFESFVNLPGTNQFETIQSDRGYAVLVTSPNGAILPLGSNPAPRSAQTLSVGRHLLPGPSETMAVSNWLTGWVPGLDYSEVRGLRPGATNASPVTVVRPGQAYSVTVLRARAWFPPRSAKMENPSSVRFVYDADGGRVKKVSASGVTTFIGSGFEVAPSGQSTVYIFAGTQRIAARNPDGTLRFFHPDHLGSANAVTDGTGALIGLLECTPFGSISRQEGIADVPHKFSGQREESELGLYCFNARYYDPELGRFISPDPLHPAPDCPQSLNHYSYALNNPVALNDPSGHFFQFVFMAIATALKAAILQATFAVMQAAIAGGDLGEAARRGAIRGAVSTIPYVGGVASIAMDRGRGKGGRDLAQQVAASFLGHSAGDWTSGFAKGDSLRLLVNRTVSAAVGAQVRGDDPLVAAGFGAASATATLANRYYTQRVGYGPTWRQAEGTAVGKEGSGHPTSWSINNIGFAAGEPDTFARHPFRFFVSGKEGGLLSETLNLIPGFNSFAGLHDEWLADMRDDQKNTTWINFPSMVPALIVNYTALMDGQVEEFYESYLQHGTD